MCSTFEHSTDTTFLKAVSVKAKYCVLNSYFCAYSGYIAKCSWILSRKLFGFYCPNLRNKIENTYCFWEGHWIVVGMARVIKISKLLINGAYLVVFKGLKSWTFSMGRIAVLATIIICLNDMNKKIITVIKIYGINVDAKR